MSVKLPERITRGESEILVRGSVKPPPSRIKEVAFIFGPKASETSTRPWPRNRSVKAHAGRPRGQRLVGDAARARRTPRPSWSSPLASPPASVSPTSNPDEVAVIDAKPEDMKPAAPKRGAITGTVKVGDLAPARLDGLPVRSQAATPARTRSWRPKETDAKGAFSFTDLEPERVSDLLPEARRDPQPEVRQRRKPVAPGQTLTLELELTSERALAASRCARLG